MRYSSTYRSPRKLYLAVLIGLCLLAMVLPRSITGKLINLVQVILPLQDAAGSLTDSLLGGEDDPGGIVSREEHEQLQRKHAALAHQAAALATRVAELEKDVEILTATRLWNAGGNNLGVKGHLVPARVILGDLLSWRSSQLINAGSLQGVRDGAPVASRYFVDQGESSGLQNGMAILLGESLIGQVERVGTHTARIKLLSDVSIQRKVRIGRLTDEGFTSLDRFFWLMGRGGGVMQIRDAQRRDVDEGHLMVGDIVLSDPGSDVLPAAMTIGSITHIETDPKNPLLSILTVRSAVDPESLRRVYVYDPSE